MVSRCLNTYDATGTSFNEAAFRESVVELEAILKTVTEMDMEAAQTPADASAIQQRVSAILDEAHKETEK
jgi:hypothetical protein